MTTKKRGRERATATLRTLVTPTMKRDFQRWAGRRDLTDSTALRVVIADLLSRDAQTASRAAYVTLGALVGPEPVGPPGAVYDPSCGMFHDRPLEPGEVCEWAVDAGGRGLPAPYTELRKR